CATDPNAQACTSCGLKPNFDNPECTARFLDPADDALGIRFFHMKQRFGLDPMYPAARYARGLGFDPATGQPVLLVQDRNGAECQNPLFTAALPGGSSEQICKLARGPRGPNLVFYAAITGVPGDLVPPSGDLTSDDWRRVLGNDPLRYDFTGADPRMLESVDVRAGVAGDRDTERKDLQYACTFELATPKPCDLADPACDCKGEPGPL